MGTWEHIKMGGAPQHNALGFLLLGEIPQNTHRNKKKGSHFWDPYRYTFRYV
jgi:hypothetical protein